jgi:hypothetical protein
LNVGSVREMFNELQLRDFFRFIATDPIAVMEMLAPECAVIRTGTVVMVKDALFVIGARHDDAVSLPLWFHCERGETRYGLRHAESMVTEEDLRVRGVEEDEADFLDRGWFAQKQFNGGRDDRGGEFARVAVGARGEGREGDRTELVLGGKGERVAIAGGETLGVGFRVAATDRTDGVDDVLGGQVAGGCDYNFTSGQALRKTGCAKLTAFFENARAAATMDSAVNAASAKQSAVRGVHDGVHGLRGDVANQDVNAIFEKSCE